MTASFFHNEFIIIKLYFAIPKGKEGDAIHRVKQLISSSHPHQRELMDNKKLIIEMFRLLKNKVEPTVHV
jgi:hypothetical protein